MESIGLFEDFSADSPRPVMWRPQGIVNQQELLSAATGLHCQFAPQTRTVINLCRDRYFFIVGFVAGLLAGRTSLLPSNRQPQTILDLIKRYPNSVLLVDFSVDEGSEFSGLPTINVAQAQISDEVMTSNPQIAADAIAAIVFTSGSTGEPTAIDKPWATLTGTTALLAERFLATVAIDDAGAMVSIVATVPSQHMYGLEMTVLMALRGGCLLHAGHPFFPDDVASALQQISSPRLLVTTPVHMTALLGSALDLPELFKVISATAPLDAQVAQDAELVLNTTIEEIYGCSEAGSLASRHTRAQPQWTLLDGIMMFQQGDTVQVNGPHLTAAVALQDRLEIIDDVSFRLLGRGADMLNVAGKRASLADLSQQLRQIDGVEDGLFFLRDSDDQQSQRPAAVVVSSLSVKQIAAALAQRIDPIFLPRPLKKVPAIPRNEVGKTPRSLLLPLLADSIEADS